MGKQQAKSGKPAPSTNGNPTAGKETERLPAYFLSLTLENVRCFGPKQTLDLSKDGKPARWTIILGLNGTGKTTLLQSLVGFNDLRPPATPDQLNEWIPRFRRFFSEGVTTFLAQREQEAFIAIHFVKSSGLTGGPFSTLGHSFQLTHGGVQHGSLGDADEPVPRIWCCAYGAGRRVGTASLSEGEADDPTATLFSDRAELRNPEEWLLQLDYAAKSHNKDAAHRLKQATELLLSIMPEDEITDVRFTTSGGVNPKARAEFQTPYGWVPLRQLGYGYQTLITWVADLVSRMAERYPDSKNPLAEPAVVLVDEIDLHLHPKWQRKLIGFLTEKFPNTQFIATAHSPLVVQAAADANLAVLRRAGDHVVIDNDVDNIRNWRVDQILTSDLFGLETARPPQIEALLMERKALLTKPKMTAADKRRVEELETKMGELPTGESAQEVKEREEIRKTLELLMKERKPAQ